MIGSLTASSSSERTESTSEADTWQILAISRSLYCAHSGSSGSMGMAQRRGRAGLDILFIGGAVAGDGAGGRGRVICIIRADSLAHVRD